MTAEEQHELWAKTKAILKQAGARVNQVRSPPLRVAAPFPVARARAAAHKLTNPPTQTPQGHVPLTALPSLPPSLSLVQLPPVPLPSPSQLGPGRSSSTDSSDAPPTEAADFRYHEPLLIQNINLRRLGLGGRAGFRLPPPPPPPATGAGARPSSTASSSRHAPAHTTGATPAQQLHFLQAYQLPVPSPSTTTPTSLPSLTPRAGRPPTAAPARDFTRTVIALGRTVQHALALFGLGPVKSYLAGSVVRVVQLRVAASSSSSSSAGREDEAHALSREEMDRALLEALLEASPAAAAASEGQNPAGQPPPQVELDLEDWAEALGLPLPPTAPASASAFGPGALDPLELQGTVAGAGAGAAPLLLEGDGLLCDTTVAALSVFRLAYAERFVTSSHSHAHRAGAGAALADDGSLLPPALLAALLSLVVATRGKMVVLGAGSGSGSGAGAGDVRAGQGHRAAGATLGRRGRGKGKGSRRAVGGGGVEGEEEEKVPKDALGKRERFLRCVEAFQVRPLSRSLSLSWSYVPELATDASWHAPSLAALPPHDLPALSALVPLPPRPDPLIPRCPLRAVHLTLPAANVAARTPARAPPAAPPDVARPRRAVLCVRVRLGRGCGGGCCCCCWTGGVQHGPL